MYAGHENVPLACCVPTSRRRHLILGDASGWGKAFTYSVLRVYRASHVLGDLGWVDLDLGSSPRLVGRYCSYLLPKQGGGTSQIQVNKTQSTRTWDALYISYVTTFKEGMDM